MNNAFSNIIRDHFVDEAMRDLIKVHVSYPGFRENLKLIERCRAMTRITGKSECCAILGESGVGKSYLAEYFCRNYPPSDGPNGRIVPVLLVEVPKLATIKSLLAEMLIKLGYADSVEVSRIALMRALWTLLSQLQVDTIIIDEGQHMSNSETRDREVADWLKTLINESKCCIVLMGMPSTETILASSECEQTTQRFKRIKYIKPFTWNNKNNGNDFRVFVREVEKALPFQKSSNLASPECALRLFCATRGYLRPLIRVIRAATFDGLLEEAECLDLALLDRAIRLEINERMPLHPDPIFGKLDDIFASVLGPWKPVMETPNSRRRGKNKKAPSSAESLRK